MRNEARNPEGQTMTTSARPHNLSKMHRLEEALTVARLEASKAATALVAVWDAKGAHETVAPFAEDHARRAVAAANDKVTTIRNQWCDEWKRCGSPL